jgi:4-aminobutyrate aminotransferase
MAVPKRAAEAVTQTLRAIAESGSPEAAGRIRAHISSPALAQFSDFIAERASGSYVWTTDGQKHLDMATGIGVVSTGHCHPKVVKAIQDQAANLIFAQQNVFAGTGPMAGLLDRLLDISPEGLTKFSFANSGAEAVENAIKVARGHTGRQNIIAFDNSFHGRTFGTMALTNSKTYYRAGFGPLLPAIVTSSYPYCLHCKARQAAPDGGDWYKLEPNIPPFDDYSQRRCCNGPLESLQWMLKQSSAPEDTAAIIIEPIQGEGGFLTPPPEFLKGLRKICDEHGILLILDEVQAGVGRTGKWWGHQHVMDASPDIMVFAKGIASGFPLAGIATREDYFSRLRPGSIGGTYSGNTLGCAAACATIDAIREDDMLENVTARGQQLAQGLVELSKRFPITDVRGRGLMVAAEFGAPEGGLVAKAGTAAAVTKAAGRRNMLLLSAGARESIRFLPPLNVKESEIAEALHILEASLEEVFGRP